MIGMTAVASHSECEVVQRFADGLMCRTGAAFKGVLALAAASALTFAAESIAQGVYPPGAQFNAGTAYVSPILAGNVAGGNFGNGNGKTFDIALTNGTGSGPVLSVYLGNGDGTFAAPANYSLTATGWSTAGIHDGLNLIFAGPVTGPGKQDLLVTDNANNLFVIPGNGDGTFGTPQSVGQVAATVYPYLNSGGTLNLIITNYIPNNGPLTYTVTALFNNGSGSYSPQVFFGSATYSITEADELDIAGTPTALIVGSDGTAMSSTFGGSIFGAASSFNLNLPSGATPISHVTPFTFSGNTSFAAISGSWIFFWIGNSDGSFQTPYQLSVGATPPVQLGTADLNGDGIADLLVLEGGSYSGAQAVIPMYGNSNGTFAAGFEIGPGVYGSEFAIGDLNGDNHPDIVLEQAGQGLTVLLNQGDGTYPHPNTFPQAQETVNASPVAPFPAAMVAADLNGDQLTDLVVVNGPNPTSGINTNSISVFVNEGNGTTIANGTFANEQIYPVGNQPIAAAVATVNGQPSIFVANAKDTTVSFLQGKGDGSFDAAATFPSGGLTGCNSCTISSMAVGTIDSSGFPGVVVAAGNSITSGNLYVFTHGANGWTNSATYAVPAGITSMLLYQATAGSNADLVVSTAGACQYGIGGSSLADGEIYVYPGNGAGTFGTPTKFTSTLAGNAINWNPGQLAIGWLTGNATPDLVVLQNPQNNGCLSYGAATVPPISIFSNITSATPTEVDLASPFAGDTFTGLVDGQQLHAAVADVNEDGFPDLVLAENGLIAVIPGTGSTNFGVPIVQVASSDTGGLATGAFFTKGAAAAGADAATASTSGITPLPSLSGGPAYAEFSVTTLAFPPTDSGKTAQTSFTLTNTGKETLKVPSFAVLAAGGAASEDFSVPTVVCGTTTNPANISIADGDQCTFTVDFKPKFGGSFSAQIEFDTNAASSNVPTTPIAGAASYQQIVLLQGNGTSGIPIGISPSTLPGGTLNTSYLATFSAAGGSGGYTFSETGALPKGLTLQSNGALSGTPTTAGSFPFTVKATDSSSASGTAKYTLVVTCPKLIIDPASGVLPPATEGFGYEEKYAALGTNGALKWSLIPTLPPGIILDVEISPYARIYGTPQNVGRYSFGVSVADSLGCEVQNNYLLKVYSALKVGPATFPAATVDKPYVSAVIPVSGGKPPFTYTVNNIAYTNIGLPPGISLGSTTGKLTGTPILSGSYVLEVFVSDANGAIGKATFGMTVNPSALPIVIAPPVLPPATEGLAYSQPLTATGGGGGYIFSTPAAKLPKGITLVRWGMLVGTPTVKGTYPIFITATDHLGVKGGTNYVLTVKPPPTYTYTPVISPNGGTFKSSTTVSITDATIGAKIYYTTNGTTPNLASTKYTGAFSVKASETLKAVAVAPHHTISAVATAKFFIK